MRMPNNPHNWAEFSEIIAAWWRGDTPVGSVLLAFVMAVLRIAYTGGGWKKMVLEGLLCGALTLSVASGLEYLELSRSLSIAIGGGIGFIGVEQFRKVLLAILNTRFGNSPRA
ncbi:phage holin, lambda family [Erwinia sp. S43]|uniref:phage holin, lambda family n=1 Tax=unclassified Erwinia TaxID=2622719 RepID=UPI00190E03EE|nr:MULTISPECIES: phage holin, lambda family [unclassified Erwinia]MBK0003156.1 phage holin, lambda family [Erwinia sp. S38]MBK0032733.1 phage holin, lambda family [Erwinia sp. S43]